MIAFLWNLLLAIAWVFSLGQLTVLNLAIGFILGYIVLWLARDLVGSGWYCSRVPKVVEFLLFFLWSLFWANLRVAYDVLTPRYHMRPGIIALPLDARTDNEITLLANLISLTPGTLSLHVSEDRQILYVHSMYIDDVEREKHKLKHNFERRLLELMR